MLPAPLGLLAHMHCQCLCSSQSAMPHTAHNTAGGPWQPQSLRRTSSVVSRAAAIVDAPNAQSLRMVYFTSRDSYPCSRVILLTKRDKPLSLNASRDSYPYLLVLLWVPSNAAIRYLGTSFPTHTDTGS